MRKHMNKKQLTNDSDEGFIFPVVSPQEKIFCTDGEDGGKIYDYYLTGTIGKPADYVELCHSLRLASEEDVFLIRFNSPGGRVDSSTMIINAIQQSPSYVIGIIEAEAGSAASMIFLACDDWEVGEYSELFVHTVSSGFFGKEHESFEASSFLNKQTRKRIIKTYRDFMDEEEIEKVLSGADFYFDSEEILQRLEGYREAREEKRKSLLAESEGPTPKTIPEMVEEAVDRSISKFLEKGKSSL